MFYSGVPQIQLEAYRIPNNEAIWEFSTIYKTNYVKVELARNSLVIKSALKDKEVYVAPYWSNL